MRATPALTTTGVIREWAARAPAVLSVLLVAGLCGVVGIGVWRAAGADAGEVRWRAIAAWLPDGAVLMRTLLIPLAIGVLGTLLGAPTAWAMRRLPSWWLAVALAPLLLPNYVVYAALSGVRSAGTPIGDAIIRGPSWGFAVANVVQATVSLALWSWPIAALVLLPAARGIDQDLVDSARGVGVGWLRRSLLVGRLLGGALLLSIAVITLLMLGSAVPLHVAQVETWAIELWRGLFETGGRSASVWVAGAPLCVGLGLGGAWLAVRLGRSSPSIPAGAGRPATAPVWVCALAVGTWCVSFLGPMVLLAAQLRSVESLRYHWHDLGPPLLASGRVSAVVGLIGVLLAAGAGAGSAGGAVLRRAIGVCGVALAAMAVAPGIFVGHALVASGDIGGLLWLNRTSAGLVGGDVIRLGIVGVALGWWGAGREPAELVDCRRQSHGASAWGWMMSWGRGQVGLLIGAGLALALLSLHEIEASTVTAPPGPRLFPQYMLDLLHYLRDEELKVATIAVLVGGGLVAWASVLLMRTVPSVWGLRRVKSLAVVGCVLLLVGCGDRGPTDAAPFEPDLVFGGVGPEDGRFLRPRGIDGQGGKLWIVDKTARVQQFDARGEFEASWVMPEFDNGMPVGLSVGPDGLVYVADTHEHRVMVYRPTESGGEVVASFGAYGTGDGQFVYPTDVAVLAGPDGVTPERIYVSEYGGNDRVSVFDGGYRFLFSFGREGYGQDPASIEFARPQSLLLHPGNGDLYVTDSVNHRVGRFAPDGTLVSWFGRPGPEPGSGLGEFRYPYGLGVLPDGDLLVCEMGNNRLQRIDPETGEGVAVYGVAGRDEGTLQTPWGVAALGWDVYILDTGNHRVQRVRMGGGWMD